LGNDPDDRDAVELDVRFDPKDIAHFGRRSGDGRVDHALWLACADGTPGERTVLSTGCELDLHTV
jgi:hypothetical protein